jgi:hypothetical protein
MPAVRLQPLYSPRDVVVGAWPQPAWEAAFNNAGQF